VDTLITKEFFEQLLIRTPLNIAENEALWIVQFSDDNWGVWYHLIWYVWVSITIIIISKKVNKQVHKN